MHAVRVFEYGGPEALHYVEVDTPLPGPGEALVRVRGATVSGFDLLFRKGALKQFPGRPAWTLPHQLGREGAGEVAAIGPEVSAWAPGDRVVLMPSPACGHCASCRRGEDALCFNSDMPGMNRFGTYAEYVTVRATDLLRAPDGVPFETLAAAVHNFVTVWHGAFTRGNLRPGQDVLVTGAGGGLGSAAIELVRFGGARAVIAVTGAPEKTERLLALGADHVINWREEEVPTRVQELTGGVGVDLALDNVGGPLFGLALASLRLGGTLVAAAEVAGKDVTINLARIVGSHVSILGTRSSSRDEQEKVLSLVGSGRLKPVISEVMALSQAVDAHRALENDQLVGKIVLVP
jgi:putative oxidoreductase